jgi:hypothetical protein
MEKGPVPKIRDLSSLKVGSPPILTGGPIVWVATSDRYCSRLFENHLLGSEYTESPLSAWWTSSAEYLT